MKYKKLGSSDLSVSEVCLGTMTFGEQNSEAEAHQQLDYALAHGVNFIDTAEMYPVMPRAETVNRTEQYIGTWIKDSGKREKVIIATKVSGPSRGMPWIRNGENDLDEKNIRAAVEGSLRRLQTDYIDLYQLHWPSRNAPIFGQKEFAPELERESVAIEKTLDVLDTLIKEGKIRHIGVSNETPWGVSEFIKHAERKQQARIVSIQNPYHLMNRSYEQGLTETCFREHVGLLAYSPLAFGRLTGKYVDNAQAQGRLTQFPPTWSPRYMRQDVIATSARYTKLARDFGYTPTQLALAWCYSRWFVTSTIIGATTLQQLEENIRATDVKLTEEVIAAINAIHAVASNPAQ
ncbi:aldo/keto reductase [Undibacterium sp. LX40W]|uniref:Protein tas n=1 Tax=Undibacterium nitidum TaxID=2762298 RepID=A0A923HJJ6_9BURK|nr:MULTISPECIES: aldo/keto reductase [Undibacterium]MBC3880579.1 aldo/keto reductase [Undibacterium nitidum]MBC3890685.1 aldo/keto reductase [Undibacterium sp. LX40W]